MRSRDQPPGRLLGECVKGLADAAGAPIDVPEKLGLGEHAVGERVGVVVKRWWRCPRLQLGSQVVVETQQRVVSEEPGSRAVQSPMRTRTRGRLVRPQVR